jgi:hypothetical protein
MSEPALGLKLSRTEASLNGHTHPLANLRGRRTRRVGRRVGPHLLLDLRGNTNGGE